MSRASFKSTHFIIRFPGQQQPVRIRSIIVRVVLCLLCSPEVPSPGWRISTSFDYPGDRCSLHQPRPGVLRSKWPTETRAMRILSHIKLCIMILIEFKLQFYYWGIKFYLKKYTDSIFSNNKVVYLQRYISKIMWKSYRIQTKVYRNKNISFSNKVYRL